MDPRKAPPIPAVMRGAVDLGALKERAAAASRPSRPGPAPAAGEAAEAPGNGATASESVIVDVSEATFQADVIERSMSTPVVIDFWADWCGPCRQLSPLLERLAVADAGAWVLAKIDVDANPRIAQAFRVQGIPMVFAVVGGQPVDAFSGVIPEAQLRQWLDAVLQVAGAGGGAVGAGGPVSDPELDAADDALVAGDLDTAERAYKKILSDRPADEAAAAGLVQVDLLRRTGGADPAVAIAAADAAPDDLVKQLLAADLEVMSGLAVQAYARLTALARRVRPDDREQVRAHLVSLFALAAPDDPAVLKARRDLASALF